MKNLVVVFAVLWAILKLFRAVTLKNHIPNKEDIDCNNKNIIYHLTWKVYGNQYVGQTSYHLRARMTGHRFRIFYKEKGKPIAQQTMLHDINKF